MRRYSVVLVSLLLALGCSRTRTAGQGASVIVVNASAGGSIVIRTSVAEFDILPSGYVQSYLVKGTRRLTLDEPQAAEPGDYVVSGGKDFASTVGTGGVIGTCGSYA